MEWVMLVSDAVELVLSCKMIYLGLLSIHVGLDICHKQQNIN